MQVRRLGRDRLSYFVRMPLLTIQSLEWVTMVIGYHVWLSAIYNGNLFGWSGIWSVIIELYKIRRARSASLI